MKLKASEGKQIKIRAEINTIKYRKPERHHWNQNLVLWKDQQHWQTFSYNDQEKKERLNLLKSGMILVYYYQFWRNKKVYKRILWAFVCQWTGQLHEMDTFLETIYQNINLEKTKSE